jgi:hypothetical protein
MTLESNCQRIADIIKDYRRGEVPPMNVAHVRRWIGQFPEAVRASLAAEVGHVLERTYIDEEGFKTFLRGLVRNPKLVGADPAAFWRHVCFLRLQQAGSSQRDMLAMFETILMEELGLALRDCGATPHTFMYLDDVVYSGGRVKSDLVGWITQSAPKQAKVAVVSLAIHSLGEWFASQDIKEAAQAAGKTVGVDWWRSITVEDRKFRMAESDVLRPTRIPVEAADYMVQLGAEPVLRTGTGIGPLEIFSSAQGRELIEQEFLKAGVRVRQLCTMLPAQMRPLGSTLMRTTGFGSMIVTFRNCANNTPLVLWAGNPWYPLLPRRTN